MPTLFTFKRLLVAAVAALALGAMGTSQAKAGEIYCGPTYVLQKVVCYKTVVCYETRVEAYKVCVTKYDYCGRPYQIHFTRYRDVQVAISKQVAFTKLVKVPVG